MNIAVADPSVFRTFNGYLGAIQHGVFTVGSLTGVVAHFENDPKGNREICIKPFFHSWPRFTAVLGDVFKSDILHFRTWQKGVVFGTSPYNMRGPRLQPKKGNKSHAPLLGANLPVGEKSMRLCLHILCGLLTSFCSSDLRWS